MKPQRPARIKRSNAPCSAPRAKIDGSLEHAWLPLRAAFYRKAGRDEGMVLANELKDVVMDLSKPVPVSMTNLLNLTHTTHIYR
jgi:hypothetical protein